VSEWVSEWVDFIDLGLLLIWSTLTVTQSQVFSRISYSAQIEANRWGRMCRGLKIEGSEFTRLHVAPRSKYPLLSLTENYAERDFKLYKVKCNWISQLSAPIATQYLLKHRQWGVKNIALPSFWLLFSRPVAIRNVCFFRKLANAIKHLMRALGEKKHLFFFGNARGYSNARAGLKQR